MTDFVEVATAVLVVLGVPLVLIGIIKVRERERK